MKYEDFVLQLGAGSSRRAEVRAACATSGEARGRLRFSIPPAALVASFPEAVHGYDSRQGRTGSSHLGTETPEPSPEEICCNPRVLGATLFEAIFNGSVRSLLDHSLGTLAGNEERGLRIRLQLDITDTSQTLLHSLPWELLYKADTGDFLGLSRQTPIIRYLETPRAVRPMALPESLHVLALAPAPPGLPPLDLKTERENLEALRRTVRGLEVDFLEPANLSALRRELVEREIHVLHFMGHGDFDSRTGEGIVYLEGSDGRAEPVAAEALVAIVKDSPELRLAVLNACSTGRAGGSGGVNPFLGMAPALTQAGLPAVLAMQLPISDEAALTFSEALYSRLISGDSLGAAVTEARLAIHATAPRSMEWAIPALFSRVPDGTIFRSGQGRSAPDKYLKLQGLDHLLAENFEEAIRSFRAERLSAQGTGLPSVALGVALGRGRRLGRLPFQTAQEMHRLFAHAFSTPDGKPLAAAALLALKVDYFRANSVREPTPTLEEVSAALAGCSWNERDEQLVSLLRVADQTYRLLLHAGGPDGRKWR